MRDADMWEVDPKLQVWKMVGWTLALAWFVGLPIMIVVGALT